MQISIPKPCHENWNTMTPNEKGAFCGVCSKTVVDFTGMNETDIQLWFMQRSGQNTCGRFTGKQLEAPNVDIPRLLKSALPYWKKFLAIVVIAFGTLFTGCGERTMGKITVLGEPVARPGISAIDTVPPPVGTTSHLMGDTVAVPVPVMGTVAQVDSTCHVKMGKVLAPQPVKKPGKGKKD